MNSREWVVHPNRSELGPDDPGRNGHFRASGPRRRPSSRTSSVGKCCARVSLPLNLSHHADAEGTISFAGADWSFVVGAAHSFARQHTTVPVPPPFGFKDRGQWWWWDGTTSDESILEGPDAVGYVEEFLKRLFPGQAILLMDQR